MIKSKGFLPAWMSCSLSMPIISRDRGGHGGERMILESARLAVTLTPDAQFERESFFFSA